MSKSRLVGPKAPGTLMGYPAHVDIGKSLQQPSLPTVDARKGFERRVVGGRKLAEQDIATRKGDIRTRADAYTKMLKRGANERARDQDLGSKFWASGAGQYGGAAYLDRLKKDKSAQSRAMQEANLKGMEYESGQLGQLAQRAGQLRSAAEAGDITGGGFPGLRAHSTGLGPMVMGPTPIPKKTPPKTTAPKKKPEEVYGESGHADGAGSAEGPEAGP